MFKIDKDIDKIGEFYPIDFSKAKPIFSTVDQDLEDGIFFYPEKEMLVLVKGDNVYNFKEEKYF